MDRSDAGRAACRFQRRQAARAGSSPSRAAAFIRFRSEGWRACNQTVMGDGISIGFVDFPALLFDFDQVRCVLARSILVRNWCGLRPYVVIAGGQSEGFCYLTKSGSHLLKLRFSACDSKVKVAGIIAICFFDCKLAPKALNLRLPFEGQWGTQKTNTTAGTARRRL